MALAETVPEILSLDVTAFPLVILRFPAAFDERAMADLRAAQARLYAFEKRYVSLVDMRGASIMPKPMVRREAHEWTKAQESRLREVQVANVLLVDSALVRAGIQAVHWFAPPPMPTLVSGSVREGARYLREQAKARGLELGILARDRLDALEQP